MRKRFRRSSFNKFLGHEAVAGEVAHSHAYGKVAKIHRSLPKIRRTASPEARVVPGYRHSMVGSIAQYRDKTPLVPKAAHAEKSEESTEGILGNRPKSGTHEKGKISHASDRRHHHFVEPPQPKFNRFD